LKSKRNRIVIDLNQPPPPGGFPRSRGARPGRTGRILAIIGAVLLLLLIGVGVGVFFWWQHLKSQPAYTLALLIDAAQREDQQELDRILDLDKISESFVSDVRSRVTGTSILDSLVPSQLDQIVSNITPRLKETLREVLPNEIRRVTEPAKGKPVFLIALSAPYFATIKQNDASATVDLKFKDEQIQLTMQQAEDRWRVISIRDDRLTNIIVDTAKKGLSQRGSQFQDDIIRRLREMQTPTPSPSP
jgi:flagellar basal body-associated protein FliL